MVTFVLAEVPSSGFVNETDIGVVPVLTDVSGISCAEVG
jgi:hypothetical protein